MKNISYNIRRVRPCTVRSGSRASDAPHCRAISTSRKHDESIKLPDGRIMGFSEYGSSEGSPFLYFHGYPSSRLEGVGIDTIARKRNLRVFTLERPGFGISTPQPGRRIIDFAQDVKAFTDSMGLKRVAIMGGSGGGPYALACAHELPRDLMSAVGLFASGGPFDKSWEGIPMRSKLAALAAKHRPSALGGVATGVVGTAKWALRSGPGSRWFEGVLQKQREASDQFSTDMTLAGEREDAIRTLFEGFAQGSDAFVEEAVAMAVRPWGFDLENVQFPIQIFHGDKDVNAPIVWIRNMAKRLSDWRLKEYAGNSHYTIISRLEEILAELVPHSLEVDKQSA